MIERLAKDAFKSDYYNTLYKKVVRCFCMGIFSYSELELSSKELRDILRFADIFSNSQEEKMRNISYKIVSFLYDKYENNSVYNMYCNAILKRLDNFPALKRIGGSELPVEREIQHLIHKDILKSPVGENFFLPSQYNIYQHMKKDQSLSFSGPTSMGKSFIIKQFIISKIKQNIKNNFCIIVPTRALIKQYVLDLNSELSRYRGYKILTNANILEFINIHEFNYIFVLTQERLNVLLYSKYKIKLDYLFVDEAHKIFDNDTRALTFYTSVDACLLSNKHIKVFFASPLIQNPEIFTKAYNKNNIGNYKTDESPVNQNLFYIDLMEKKIQFIENGISLWNCKWKNFFQDKNSLFYKVGKEHSNIVYLSSKDNVVKYAMNFVEYLKNRNINLIKEKNIEEINNICSMIEKNIHKDYYLIKALKNGVAFHYGKIPSIIKESIEELFKNGVIKYIFCTSTLLEGVNLPAKNIFIMANYKGNYKMKAIDFWNLSGRAGRLGYEYYGNVFCVNDHNRRGAWKDKSILNQKYNIRLEDVLASNLTQNSDSIKEIISSVEPKEEVKKDEKYNNYLSNIIQIDSLSNNNSAIIEKVNEVDKEIVDLCPKFDAGINYDIVNSSKSIDYKIQRSILKDANLILLGSNINYSACKDILNLMYDKYRWDIKEERLKSKSSLDYIALLMVLWMNGSPLSEIINSSIENKKKFQKSIRKNSRQWIKFNYTNIEHINILINNIIEDIDDILRFDLEKYFNHYYSALVNRYGEDRAGLSWALYLEFGTRDMKNIILQNAGFSRYVSTMLLKNYSRYVMFDDDNLIGISNDILDLIKTNNVIFHEVKNSSYLMPIF